jgi:FxsC-like protein
VRGAPVPDAVRGTPYFLISYPHEPRNGQARNGQGSERDPDTWVIRFYKDLCRVVEELVQADPGTTVGILDRDLWVGDDWLTKLPEALATCRVLVPLYSRRYFQSFHCGKEWSAFAGRPAGAGVPEPPPIVPVSWIPFDLSSVDSGIVRSVPVDYGGLASYAELGLHGIMKRAEHQGDYQKIVRQLARSIVEVVKRSPAHPRRIADYARLPSAFDPAAGPMPADPRLRVTVVAPARDRLPVGRSDPHYGTAALDWAPYRPASAKPIAQYTADFARSLGYRPLLGDLQARKRDLLGSGPPADPEILIIDPWAVTSPESRQLLERFNLHEKPWVQVAIPWNPADRESAAAGDRLWFALDSALRRKLRQCRATSGIAVEGVPSLECFAAVLPWLIFVAVKHYLGHARAFPPPGPVVQKPSLQGITLDPPNLLERAGD